MYPKTGRQPYPSFWSYEEIFDKGRITFRNTIRDILIIRFRHLLMFQTGRLLIQI